MKRRVLITGGKIVDGTGAPSRSGDLLLEDDRIAEVFEMSLAPDETIDARGLVIAPGFIDIHSHGDFTLPRDPDASAKVLQGVTTEVVGNCGLGLHPSNAQVDEMYERVAPIVFGEGGVPCSLTLGDYRARLEGSGISVNAVPLIAHGNVRGMVMGLAEGDPTETQIQAMREIVAQGMEDGAFGISTGLIYPPGAYAKTEEIVRLCEVVARAGGLYATHMRNEGPRLVEAVAEAIEIGERAKIPVQISHHKASGRANWGKVKTTLAMVDDANRRGLQVDSDVYPYTAGSTVLAALFLPLWAFEGSSSRTLERLRDPETRARILEASREKMASYANLPSWLSFLPKRWLLPLVLRSMGKSVIINSVKNRHELEGLSLGGIAKKQKKDLINAALDLLTTEEMAVSIIAHVMSEDDMRTVLTHPRTMVGTDGFPLKDGKAHPRTYGTYSRILDRYVRRFELLTLENAIHRMTGMVAKKVGLTDRGALTPGAVADIVVFDAANIEDRATYPSPHNSPGGIAHVFVGGQWTVKNGAHTGARGGRVLSKATAS